ncbi:hypothetical protein A2U01_0078836, partial [Trifolium medium]|nr:hypothetical protein [Trifolium medium]
SPLLPPGQIDHEEYQEVTALELVLAVAKVEVTVKAKAWA